MSSIRKTGTTQISFADTLILPDRLEIMAGEASLNLAFNIGYLDVCRALYRHRHAPATGPILLNA